MSSHGGRGSGSIQPTLSSPLRSEDEARPALGTEESKITEVTLPQSAGNGEASNVTGTPTPDGDNLNPRAIFTERISIDSNDSIQTRLKPRKSLMNGIRTSVRGFIGQVDSQENPQVNEQKAVSPKLKFEDTDNVLSKLMFGAAYRQKLLTTPSPGGSSSDTVTGGLEVDGDMSMGELANALRSNVARHLDAEDWLSKLHDLFDAFDRSSDSRISRIEFAEAMKKMFAINFGSNVLEKLFNYISLDNARSGYITWDNFLGFFTPKTAADVITIECAEIVTSVCISRDVSILAYGGNFGVGVLRFREENSSVGNNVNGDISDEPRTPSKNLGIGERLDECIFTKKYTGMLLHLALTASGDRLYVGMRASPGKLENNSNIDVFNLAAIPYNAPPPETRGKARKAEYDEAEFNLSYPAEVLSMALSNDDRMLCVGGMANSVFIFDTEKRAMLCELTYPSNVIALSCTRPSTALIELSTSLSDTYSGEIAVSDGAIHIFRDNRNTEHVYVNMSSAKVLPGDYPSIVGKELASDSRASCDSYCKVVFRGKVIRQYNERTGHILLEDENDEIYLLDPESMEWFAEGTATMSPGSSTIRLARQLTLHTKVVVTIPGRITSIGERNFVAVGGEHGTALVASFTTESSKVQALDVHSSPHSHKHSVSASARNSLVAATEKFRSCGMHLSRVATWERECEATINDVSFSYDGKMLAIGTTKQILVMETKKATKQHVVQDFPFDVHVSKVSVSRNGRQIAFACENCLSVRDVATGCDLFQLESDNKVEDIQLSGDGRMVVFGGKDKRVRLCNTTSGCTIHAIPVEDKVREVSISIDGRRLAIGSDDKCCRVFDVNSKDLLREWKHKAAVWAVAIIMTECGYHVAAGDYAGDVFVRHVESNAELFHHKFVASGGPPFVWAVKFSADGTRFVSGSWNKEVRVWSTADWTECCVPFHRPDRVFSLALSMTGRYVLVGDRAGGCAFYDLDTEISAINTSSNFPTSPLGIQGSSRSIKSPTPLFEVTFKDRVFCVALSPDGEMFAIAGVAKEVWLFRTKTRIMLNCFKVDGPIYWGLSFSADGKALAAGGEDNCVTIWNTHTFERMLYLPRKGVVHSLDFSNDSLILAVGTKAVIYGGRGKAEWTWRDRPDFEIVTDVMGNPEALECLLQNFPSIPSVRSPHTGETVMQHCVRNYNTHDLRALLSSERRIGFVRDTSGSHALKDALLLEKRASAVLLLEAVADGRVPTMASCLSAVTECFPLLSRTFPELLLNLVSSMKLEYEPEMMQESANYAHLPSHDKIVRGSHFRSEPRNLWQDIFNKAGHLDENKDMTSDPIVRTEVVAMRVPFENFAGVYENLDDSPLHLITSCARELNMMNVFQSDLMTVTLQYKWDRFAKEVFLIQTSVFMVLLVMVIFFAINASQSMICECTFGDFYQGRCSSPKGDDCKRSNWRSEGIAYGLWPFVFVFVGAFLLVELQQLATEGLAYFSSLWNYLDVAAFGLQFTAQILWVSVRQSAATTVRTMLAISTLLMVWKTMYYARGLELLGPLVRMIIEIMVDMMPFLVILFIFLASFAIALLIMNPDPGDALYFWKAETCEYNSGSGKDCNLFPEFLQFVANVALFGSGDGLFREGVDATAGALGRVNQLFLFILLLIVQIVLLNLIIAVMGNTYSRVQQGAIQEAAYERAHIIIEVESTWLPVVEFFKAKVTRMQRFLHIIINYFLRHKLVTAAGLEEDEEEDEEDPKFPTWLHVLRPGTLESAYEVDSSNRSNQETGSQNSDFGRIEDMVQTLSSQFEDLSNAVKDISRALNMESRSTCALNLNN